MKKILFLALTLFVAASCTNSKMNMYLISGTITGDSEALVNGKAYLYNADRDFPIRDTADVVDGMFIFAGTVDTPEQYTITIEGVRGGIKFFLENDVYSITAVDTLMKDAKVEGGRTFQLLLEYFDKSTALVTPELEEAVSVFRNPLADEAAIKNAEAIYEKYENDEKALLDSMIAAHPYSYFSLYHHANKATTTEVEVLDSLIKGYAARPEFNGNRTLQTMNNYLQKEYSLAVGQQAPDFTLNDTKGNGVTLSDVYKKGKITMIDFWAGWCGPCRNFNPTLVEIYKQYHKKGFEILGVSLDRDEEQWRDAIKTDKLNWTNVTDLNAWNGEVVNMYNVKYIPQNVFVDSEGKILARKLSEEEIVTFLEEHLK